MLFKLLEIAGGDSDFILLFRVNLGLTRAGPFAIEVRIKTSSCSLMIRKHRSFVDLTVLS